MARRFDYYDDWKSKLLTCPKCGWSGTFEQGAVEYFEQLMDSSCPACKWPHAPKLAVVSFPTLEETEANFEKLSDAEKASLAERKEFLAELERTRLKSPDELPDLAGSEIVLSWDFYEDESGASWTLIGYADQVVWSEKAVFEGAERFCEVVDILKQKYGERLADVVPADISGMYLYGDRLSSIEMVEQARASLRRSTEMIQPTDITASEAREGLTITGQSKPGPERPDAPRS